MAVAATLLAALVLAGGCSPDKGSQAAAVRVHGTVVGADGRPAARVQVALVKESPFVQAAEGTLFAVATLGAACLAEQRPPLCVGTRMTRTAADGGFSFTLAGASAKVAAGRPSSYEVAARILPQSGDPAPTVTSVRFPVQPRNLELPALRPWHARVELDQTDPRMLRVTWPALPAEGYGSSPRYTVRFADKTTGQPVWSVPDVIPGVGVDARFLEDRSGDAAVDAQTSVDAPAGPLRFSYGFTTVPFTGTAGPPLSRNAACFGYRADGRPVALSPCRLTDGDLLTSSGEADCKECGPQRSSEYIDLGSPRPLALLVVRGPAFASLALETSGDATNWAPLGTVSENTRTVTPPPGSTARYVRVKAGEGFEVSPLTELSVW